MQPLDTAPPIRIDHGVCHALFVYDVGLSIDLAAAERVLAELAQRETLPLRRAAPRHFVYRPAPLRLLHDGPPVTIGGFQTAPARTILLHDFGAAAVIYAIPLSGPLEGLVELSAALYLDPTLHRESRQIIAELLDRLRPAVARPQLGEFVEEYAIYQIDRCEPHPPAEVFLQTQQERIARILRSERGELSSGETADALSCTSSYTPGDLAVIDWNAALLLDSDAADVRGVLEFANIELLELRHLDEQLDRALEEAGRAAGHRSWPFPLFDARRGDLRRIAELQMDYALLFEGINNTLKLLGDQYLARVYRLAARRLHLGDWDASILRKLQTLESLYDKLADRQANRRMEILEWIIILLILISIVLPFLLSG